MMRRAAGASEPEETTGSGRGWEGCSRSMRPGETIMDVLIALLQSIVVLLLASGVYVALVASRTAAEPGARSAPGADHRHLVLNAHVEARHVHDHALVGAVADRLLLVGDRDAEPHGASVDRVDLDF